MEESVLFDYENDEESPHILHFRRKDGTRAIMSHLTFCHTILGSVSHEGEKINLSRFSFYTFHYFISIFSRERERERGENTISN